MTVRSLVRKSRREARIGASRTCSNCVSLADAKCQFWLFKLGQIARKTRLSVPGSRRDAGATKVWCADVGALERHLDRMDRSAVKKGNTNEKKDKEKPTRPKPRA
jgi:hypothetical protein